MRDNFGALDILSASAFHWSSKKKLGKKIKQALLALPRRAKNSKAQRPLTNLVPNLAEKVKKPRINAALQGWPVTLSWPADEVVGAPKKLNIQ
jgi:hypothetical protein